MSKPISSPSFSPTAEKSIAVLPFVNMSTDPDNEYFSDGITEEIINALTKIQGLKVIARTSSFSFKGKNIDVRTIAKQLGVATILEGSVRKASQRVRITAQLINASDGIHFWSKNYDREIKDIFAVQDEVSERIADQIRENYGHLELPNFNSLAAPKDINAYDLVLKGNYYLKRKDFDDIKKAVHLFQEATRLDPTYSMAHSALAEAYLHAAGFNLLETQEAHRLAKEASHKAIELYPKNAQAYKVLAYIKLFSDWDWKGAIDAYEQAIQHGLPEQNEFISYYAIFIEEDFKRAIEVVKKTVETDPLHVISHWQLGLTYYFARRFKEAIAAFSAAIDIDPNFGEALRYRGLVWGYLGKYKKALTDIHNALEQSAGQSLATIDLLVVKLLMGKKEEVKKVVQQSEYIDAADPAFLFAMLNEREEAIRWLEKAYQERSVMLVTLKNFWVWDNLRKDARFQAIYERMNFPASLVKETKLQAVNTTPIDHALLTASEIAHYLSQLKQLVETEQAYLDPNLSLRGLAAQLNLHSNKLSWLLNEEIGKNFNEYINAFRLATFKEKALLPANSHYTILGLAYESGFNSKTVFNGFFKKMEGMTPKVWVRSQSK